MKLFSKSFLEKLEEKCGSITLLNHYLNDLKMPFPEAILKLAKFHSLKPEYYSPKEKETPDEKITNGSDSLLTS